MIKQYCEDNIEIKIIDFELLDVSFYGCDARFEFEVRDKNTGVLLDRDYETVENAFMGIDDSEEIYNFLEEKGIDFSEEYDDDFSQLPQELQKEFEEYELSLYDDMYHDYLFDGDEETAKEFTDKILEQFRPDKSLLYVVKGDDVEWISITSDYTGVHLEANGLDIHRVYNVDMEDWIYELDGCFFDVTADWGLHTRYHLSIFERDEHHPYTVTPQDLEVDQYPGYHGKVGDTLYDYHEL